jgi:regulator of protease activity HflC (stomatin/prohibitin superfamily)
MIFLFISAVTLIGSLLFWKLGPEAIRKRGVYGVIPAVAFMLSAFITTVPAGHVKVATLFGKVQDQTYKEGIHIRNPLFEFTLFDLRQKTHKEAAGIPAEDKLITQMDVSVQYRTIGDMTPEILQNTGTTDALIQVHMIPKLRSILREQGKGVEKSQDFFKEDIQRQLQEKLQSGLAEFLIVKGLQVETVLIRDVQLPNVIRTAITETKNESRKC